MPRRLPAIALLLAWLCASGAVLDFAQVFAWTSMFAGYARNESVVAAAKETFDPAKPCALCRAVCKARAASAQHGPAIPASGVEKLILIFERAVVSVDVPAEGTWPDVESARAEARGGEVPVPPPRDGATLALS